MEKITTITSTNLIIIQVIAFVLLVFIIRTLYKWIVKKSKKNL